MKQLGLIGEMHGLIEPAVAEAEHVIQLAHRVTDPLRAMERAVVDLRVVGTGAAHHEQLGCRAARELDEGEMPRVALHRDIQPGTEALDQAQLFQQGGELARRVVPLDAVRLAHDSRALVGGEITAEIAEQPRAQLLRLAHVDDLAVGGEHAVHAGTVGRVGLHRGAHQRELCVRRRWPEEVYR